jgi:hypothetical protein
MSERDKVQPKSAEQIALEHFPRAIIEPVDVGTPISGTFLSVNVGDDVNKDNREACLKAMEAYAKERSDYAAELRAEIERLRRDFSGAMLLTNNLKSEVVRIKQELEDEYSADKEVVAMSNAREETIENQAKEIERLSKERNAEKELAHRWERVSGDWRERAEQAEARCRELTEALRKLYIACRIMSVPDGLNVIIEALLADPKTAEAKTKGTKQ